jgi:glyoxylase-like metal-dependent hydrolase (beta-lactamase superfamily II)
LPEEDFGVNHRGLTHHEIIPIGTEILTVLHTPGHYPDSICLWNKKDNSVFTGDTMFVGRTGRTIGAKSNISHLYNSIYETLLILPPQTIIYSGHHYGFKKSISLRENVRLSTFFQCTSEEEFMKVMEQFEKNRRI